MQQDGNSADMLTPVVPLLLYISQFFTLMPGDVVLTGTPAGVGPIAVGDQLEISLVDHVYCQTQVCAAG
jgi:2-keto-4-pentenoate hydratase/2-oxohepta-3-ene-1,7-dioic acid hydratase in catechol pathway